MRGCLLVAESGGEVVGYLYYYRCTTKKPGQLSIYSLVVAEGWRRRRIGCMLIVVLKEQGGKLIALKCVQGSAANIFYEAIGFGLVGTEKPPGRSQPRRGR